MTRDFAPAFGRRLEMEARLEARSRRSVHGRAGGVSTERSVTQRTLEKRGEDGLGITLGIRSIVYTIVKNKRRTPEREKRKGPHASGHADCLHTKKEFSGMRDRCQKRPLQGRLFFRTSRDGQAQP